MIYWLYRIENEGLSIKEFFKTYKVPFSERQYYRYKSFINQDGTEGIINDCRQGGNVKITQLEENFLKGIIAGNPQVELEKLQWLLSSQFDCHMSISGLKQALMRFSPEYMKSRKNPKSIPIDSVVNSVGGFELIVAIAYYLSWPHRCEKVITFDIDSLKDSDLYQSNADNYDKKGRKMGRFTKNYNKRKDIRENRGANVAKKRLRKNFTTMSIIRDKKETNIRKNLALLALPVITLNGNVRTVDLALGQER